MGWGDTPALYLVTLECPDGRWWRGTVLAGNREDAVAAARHALGIEGAPLLLCDKLHGDVAPEVRESEIVAPRGWTPSQEAR